MTILLALVSAAFAALGLFLLGFVVDAALRGAAFELGTYVFVSALCLYPSYLFGRAAVRTRRELIDNPPTAEVAASRSRAAYGVVSNTAVGAAMVVLAPYPTGANVICIIVLIAAAALLTAYDNEPPKNLPKDS